MCIWLSLSFPCYSIQLFFLGVSFLKRTLHLQSTFDQVCTNWGGQRNQVLWEFLAMSSQTTTFFCYAINSFLPFSLKTHHLRYFVLMSPSQTGSSHSSRWRFFISAWLVTFFHSSRNENQAKMSHNFDFIFFKKCFTEND